VWWLLLHKDSEARVASELGSALPGVPVAVALGESVGVGVVGPAGSHHGPRGEPGQRGRSLGPSQGVAGDLRQVIDLASYGDSPHLAAGGFGVHILGVIMGQCDPAEGVFERQWG
jgi:hypothetical protein